MKSQITADFHPKKFPDVINLSENWVVSSFGPAEQPYLSFL